MIEAELPDGTVLEFPDGTDRAVIQAAVKKRLSPAPKPVAKPPQKDVPSGWVDNPVGELFSRIPGVEKMTSAAPALQGISTAPMGALQVIDDALKGAGIGKGQLSAKIAEQNRQYEESRGKDKGTFDPVRLAGELSNPAIYALQTPRAATAVGRVADAMATAAPLAMLRPSKNPEERAQEGLMGAVAGGVIPGAAEVFKPVARLVRNLWQGNMNPEAAAGRVAREVSGKRADDVVDALTKAREGQTAQQAAVPSGSTEFSALAEIAKKREPSGFRDIDVAQRNARVKALQDAGGGDAQLATALGDRAMAGKQLYGDAMAAAVKADPELAKIASNPFFQDAVPEAVKIMEAKYPGQKPGTHMTEFLQVVKEGIDKRISAFGDTALSKSGKREATKAQEALLGWLDKSNPAFEKARTQYAKDSIPVNQSEVLRTLEKTVKDPLDVSEMPRAFAKAVEDAPKTIDKATGRSYEELSQLMNPEQMKVINSIVDQFQTNATAKDMATRGMDKTARQIGAMEHIASPNLLNRWVTVPIAAARKLSTGATDKTMDALAELSKDPAKLAEFMTRAKPKERAAIVEAIIENFPQVQAKGIGILTGEQ